MSNGISFNHFPENYIEWWQLQDCVERKERFYWHKTLWERTLTTEQDSLTTEVHEDTWNMYRQRMIALCPSDDLLCDIF